MRRYTKALISLLLCLVCLMSMGTAAFAKLETTKPPAESEETKPSIINEAALAEKVQALIAQYNDAGYLKADQVSVAYTYLTTGDSWYLNPDTWFYSASMYKVPLMMVLAEKESKGELNQDSPIEGFTLVKGEEAILVNSSNDAAHAVFRFISGKTDKGTSEKETRPLYKAFAPFPDDYYHSDFVNYSYFSARFMNEVMKTLYNEPNRFPHIMGFLKQAMPGRYCRIKLDGIYEIAQKYGYFEDKQSNIWNNITAIVYTPNPFAMTVMTNKGAKAEQFMGDLAELLANYTLQLDSELTAHKEALAKEEADRIAAEQAAAQAEEDRLAAEEAAKLKAEADRKAAEEKAIKDAESAKKAAERKALMSKLLKYIGIAGGVVLVILIAIGVLSSLRKRSGKAEFSGFSGRNKSGRKYLDDYDDFEDEEEEAEEDIEDEDDADMRIHYVQRTPSSRRKSVEDDMIDEDEDYDEDEDDEEEDADMHIRYMQKSPEPTRKFGKAEMIDEDEDEEEDLSDRQASRLATLMRSSADVGSSRGFSRSSRSSDSNRSSGGYVPRH